MRPDYPFKIFPDKGKAYFLLIQAIAEDGYLLC